MTVPHLSELQFVVRTVFFVVPNLVDELYRLLPDPSVCVCRSQDHGLNQAREGSVHCFKLDGLLEEHACRVKGFEVDLHDVAFQTVLEENHTVLDEKVLQKEALGRKLSPRVVFRRRKDFLHCFEGLVEVLPVLGVAELVDHSVNFGESCLGARRVIDLVQVSRGVSTIGSFLFFLDCLYVLNYLLLTPRA